MFPFLAKYLSDINNFDHFFVSWKLNYTDDQKSRYVLYDIFQNKNVPWKILKNLKSNRALKFIRLSFGFLLAKGGGTA